MTNLTPATTLNEWIESFDTVKDALNEVFVRSAIENRGIMMSPRRGDQVSSSLISLFQNYITQNGSEADLAQTAVQFAEQGMAFSTMAKLMQQIQTLAPHSLPLSDQQKIVSFQYQFLEQFSNARELVQIRIQENSQMALQHALQQQIEQQRLSNIFEAQRNENLKGILQLNSHLATLTDQDELIKKAVDGLCQALHLIEVSVYQNQAATEWALQHSSDQNAHLAIQTEISNALKEFSSLSSQDIWTTPVEGTNQTSLIISPFKRDGQLSGALVIQAKIEEPAKEEELRIQIQTFAQNLSALLRNIELLEETQQRAKEMEVLYGRFVDDIWRDDNVQINASYGNGLFQLNQNLHASKNVNPVALNIGEHTIGELALPDTTDFPIEDQEILQTIIQEMGDALNNARLIQETRFYSNQLDVAANVSRIATTIFDRDQLIRDVVDIVKNEFGFYYVGLFLVDDEGKTAVLQAGTGEAGRIQLDQNHYHVIGGGSMIGAALHDGNPRVEQDVSLAQNFTPNKILPDTQSECALPLIAREHAIGALTVQSVEKHAFSPTTVTVLQSMANQLAIAIENASLLTQTQLNLDKTNRLYESARQIGASTTDIEVFNYLIDFAGQSKLANAIHIITEKTNHPKAFETAAVWTQPSSKALQLTFSANSPVIIQNMLKEEIFYLRQNDIETELDVATKTQIQEAGINNAIYIPIKNDEQLFGFVALLCSTQNLPDNQSLQPFLTLVDHASIILANQKLLNQSETIYKIGRSINQSITRDDAIDITVKEAGSYIGAEQCRFVLYDKQTGTGSIVSSIHPIDESIKTMPLIGDQILEKLITERAPLLVVEGRSDFSPNTIEKHLTQFNSKATYFIPSANPQEIIGFLAIDLKTFNRPLLNSHLIFVRTIVEHLTTQIENLKLLDEALNRAQELITLNQIQSNISQVISIEALAKTVYQQTKRLLDSSIFSISLFDSESKTLTPIYTICHDVTKQLPERKISEESKIYDLLNDDKQLLTNETDSLTQEEASYFNIAPSKSAVWMPITTTNGAIAGYMTIQSDNRLAYEENDQQLFRSIATQTSLALSNAQLFETIQAKNQQLLQLDQLKTQFLANMSHELRTPLNSIIGFSRVILKGIDGPITSEQEEDLSSIYANGQHLLMLINEILDMAKIEAGKMTMTFDEVDVYQSAKIASSTVRALMDEEMVKFIWDVPTDLPMITADPVRMRQILINLLSNAVKYTTAGSIRLSIRQDEEATIHIMVADTGIGIAERDFDKLFAAFEQVDNSTTRTYGGTGLGLPITKWIVDMHRGDIWFDTELKKGTTFHVKLPIEQDSERSIREIPFNGPGMALTSPQNTQPN
ncbi:MAG: GAF domain-containing protein [Chloroflexota bacterium]